MPNPKQIIADLFEEHKPNTWQKAEELVRSYFLGAAKVSFRPVRFRGYLQGMRISVRTPEHAFTLPADPRKVYSIFK